MQAMPELLCTRCSQAATGHKPSITSRIKGCSRVLRQYQLFPRCSAAEHRVVASLAGATVTVAIPC